MPLGHAENGVDAKPAQWHARKQQSFCFACGLEKPWLFEAACEAEALLLAGVPLRGLCIYPILGMPEWHEPDIWTPMGLWDPVCYQEPYRERLVCEPMLATLN